MHTCYCDGGLANRLNALLFCLILRNRFGHDWEISWTRNNWCGAAFDSLFEIDLPVVERSLAWFKERERDYLFLVHENQGGFAAERVVDNKSLPDYAAFAEKLDGPPVCYLNNLLPGFVTVEDLREALPRLMVKPSIVEAVTRFCDEHEIGDTVFGLHIRKTDFGSAVDDGEIFKMVSANANRFFICTDDAEVTERFSRLGNCHVLEKQHYPEKLVDGEGWNALITDAQGRSFPFNIKRSEQAIVEALMDLLILSRTTPVRSSYSTFFQMALYFKATGFLDLQQARTCAASF